MASFRGITDVESKLSGSIAYPGFETHASRCNRGNVTLIMMVRE